MIIKKNKITRYCKVLLSAGIIFASIFANCLHSHHLDKAVIGNCWAGCLEVHSECISADENNEDVHGDCQACSYLGMVQEICFCKIQVQPVATLKICQFLEPVFFHSNPPVEKLPRGPPCAI